MKLTSEEGRLILWGDHEDWQEVKGTKHITDNGRWSIYRVAVFKHLPTGKHYEFGWSVGATESQDESPFEYDEPTPIEVVAEEVVITKWVPVETGEG